MLLKECVFAIFRFQDMTKTKQNIYVVCNNELLIVASNEDRIVPYPKYVFRHYTSCL